LTRPSGSVHGVLVLDKPLGPTSHDVVSRLRRVFGTRRVGHAGTLDPMATGVLVVLFGEATKLSSVLTVESKEYEAVVEFGKATDSLDAQGKVTRAQELASGWLERPALGRALEVELLRELQLPPLVSAIKIGGERAYALARAGNAPELSPRDVHVHGLELLEVGERSVRVRLAVSKGYYVRAFARDLGAGLGVPAHLSSLRRLRSGAFALGEAVAFPPSADAPLLSLAAAVRRSLPLVEVNAEGALRIAQGKLIRPEDIQSVAPRATWDAESEHEAPLTAALQNGLVVALLAPSEIPNHFRVKRGIADPGSS